MDDAAGAAREHLERALDDDDGAPSPWLHIAAAGVFAGLAIADAIRHGIRDIVYELRD